MDFNSLKMNVIITVLVLFLVFLLPWADRRICRRLRLNLEGGLSDNPNADRLLRLRQRLLTLKGECFFPPMRCLLFWVR